MGEQYERLLQDPDRVSALKRDEIENLIREAERAFELEPKLIRLNTGRAIFVGDTHGDFDASKRVIAEHLSPENRVIFLGDYVDRGPESLSNINYLLALKLAYPQNLFLLMGNHEAYAVTPFYPADFWMGMDQELHQRYASVLAKLPLAVGTENGVIALHGALPEVANLEAIEQIEVGSEQWRQITWGDWQQRNGAFLGDDMLTGRPQFGEDYFQEMMARMGKDLLIRSHQPTAPQAMFGGRCLTIFTSHAYVAVRTIAIVDLEKSVKTVADVTVQSF
jgi:predicted phosphodiesterase